MPSLRQRALRPREYCQTFFLVGFLSPMDIWDEATDSSPEEAQSWVWHQRRPAPSRSLRFFPKGDVDDIANADEGADESHHYHHCS
jgi:hypothetical protein